MAYTKANYGEVEPRAPGMHFLRDALDCENLGITALEADEEWQGLEHDHADDGQEEVYLLVEGAVTIDVDDETVDLESGDAIRVGPSASRQLDFQEASTMVIVGAP